MTAPHLKVQPRVLNPDGANLGGACLNCGKPLTFWFIYQACDQCCKVRRPEKVWCSYKAIQR